ncbi:MFP1 attachment factor 1-like [Lotus japonicus]|uniref:MFP1 attachment factor 1-like n=1 Tax=Lotus japonicus TaxID=34305 RepID=UPI002585D6DD|nr:MFP1 attachment factor 1-like [Lotus japonicus]
MSDPEFQHSAASPLNPNPATSFTIWPPTQRTRDAVINRLIETLSGPSSVLSKRYGTMSPHDASAAAYQIEDAAFSAASSSVSPDDDGIQILHVYSKEISKRVVGNVKAKPPPAGDDVDSDVAPPPAQEAESAAVSDS